jgi:hypothetical protein
MNSTRAVKPATGNVRGDITGQLPTDASAKVFNTLIDTPRAIFKRFKLAEKLSATLRDAILGYGPLPKRDEAINELVLLREQLVEDFSVLTELLCTPAPLHQFEAIASLAARGFNRSDLDQWLASVYADVTSPGMFEDDPVLISGSVLAEAIRSLGQENKFRPSGAEVYESCQLVHSSMSELRQKIRKLVEAAPPHLDVALKKIADDGKARRIQEEQYVKVRAYNKASPVERIKIELGSARDSGDRAWISELEDKLVELEAARELKLS